MGFHTISILVLIVLGFFYLFLYLDRLSREFYKKQFDHGYEFAKQSLLKNQLTRNQLSEMAIHPGRMRGFEYGILKALSDYTHDKWKIEELTEKGK